MEAQNLFIEDEKKQRSQTFLNLLHSEFQRRRDKNPSYSMRAFASFLDVDQSLLSKILRGQRPLSEVLIFKIALALQLSETDVKKYFSDLGSGLSKYNRLGEDELAVISDWEPFALLELAQTQDFNPRIDWIADRLGTTAESVQLAISKLVYNKLIEVSEDGSWKILNATNIWLNSEYTTLARRKLQKQWLSKAIEALENVDLESRENMGMTIAIHPAALPEIKRRIHAFNEELKSFINTYSSHDEVYQAVIGFYPVTKRRKS